MNNPLIISMVKIPTWVKGLAGKPVDKPAAIQAAIVLSIYGISYLAEWIKNKNKNKNKNK